MKAALSLIPRSARRSTRRRSIGRPARIYLEPLVPLPAIVAHNKDLKLIPGNMSPEGVELNYLSWR